MAAFSPQVLVLDDGFQHIRLARDLNILLVDHHQPFGNGHLLPRGSLREPISAMSRADILVETRCPAGQEPSARLASAVKRYASGRPVFQSRSVAFIHRIIPGDAPLLAESLRSPSELAGKRVFAFSGLADNRGFHRNLSGLGCHLVGTSQFPDHHWFGENELATIKRAARGAGAQILVTTQKDMSRIPLSCRWPLDLVVLGIAPDFGSQSRAFEELLSAKLLQLSRFPCRTA
jgi:tetraacyldisaccharide 4'-kinase